MYYNKLNPLRIQYFYASQQFIGYFQLSWHKICNSSYGFLLRQQFFCNGQPLRQKIAVQRKCNENILAIQIFIAIFTTNNKYQTL